MIWSMAAPGSPGGEEVDHHIRSCELISDDINDYKEYTPVIYCLNLQQTIGRRFLEGCARSAPRLNPRIQYIPWFLDSILHSLSRSHPSYERVPKIYIFIPPSI